LALALHRAYLRGHQEPVGLMNKDIVAASFLAQHRRHQAIIETMLPDVPPEGGTEDTDGR